MRSSAVFTGCVVLVCAIATAALAVYAATPGRPFRMNLLVGFLVLAAGALSRHKTQAFLFLWVLVESFGTDFLRTYYPQSLERDVYYVLHWGDFILLALCAAWFTDRLVARQPGNALPRDCLLALGGLSLMCVLSGLESTDAAFSLYSAGGVVRGSVIFAYVAHHAQDRRVFRGIIVVLLAALCFQASLAVLQEVAGGDFSIEHLAIKGMPRTQILAGVGRLYRVSGTYGSANYFSFLFLDFMLPVVASLLLFRGLSRIRRGGVALLAVTSGVALIFTLSRGAWLALLVGALSFVAGLRVASAGSKPPATWRPVAVALLLGILPTIYVVLPRLVTPDSGAAAFRVPLMQVAAQMIRSHPGLGVGAGSYVAVMDRYDSTATSVTSTLFAPVHNLYLFIAAECGLPALLCFLAFLLLLFRRAWRAIRTGAGNDSLLALGLTCGLTASLFHGLFESINLGEYFMFWLVAGLLAALERVSRQHLPSPSLVH
jgi:hypothetical protein